MAINTTTVETNLTTKLNATSGTTDAKEFLLLGKAVEALTPSVTVSSVQTEGTTQVAAVNTAGTTQVAAVNTAGTTQVAAVQAAGSGFAALTGATFTGAVNGTSLTLSGDLTVNGTQTVLNTATLTVDDLNITVADGAADAAAADGAGLTVDGASATFAYANTGDKWTMNKALDVTGAVTATGVDVNGALSIEEVKEKLITDATTTGTYNFDAVNGAVVYFSGDMGANRTLNFRGDGSTTLDSLMTTGELMTFTLIAEQGGTGYYFNTITVDGYTPNKKWQGGSPPTSGNASSNDIYTITIQKFSASSWRIYASLTQYDN